MTNEEYTRKVLPFLKIKYFEGNDHQIVFEEIHKFVDKYKNIPSKEALEVEIDQRKDLNEDTWKSAQELLKNLSHEKVEQKWLVETTEQYCKERALHLAVLDGISIIGGNDKDRDTSSLPDILSDALSVSFDISIGHDYIDNAPDRFSFYHRKEEKIPFDLEYFNKITNGGLPNKTLNIVMSGTGVGKTLFMCHHAANVLLNGYDVLYITLEMAEERIAERIDANLLNIRLDDLVSLPKSMYEKKIENLRKKFSGRLIIKEYPTAAASTNHFRALLNELNLKRNFKPDIIFVDYINICSSSRIKPGQYVNSYSYIKSIAEELRGLAVEFKVPIMSATQTNRQGFQNTDVGLEDTSESFGLPATADFMFAIISNDKLEEVNQILVKQLKNRYGDPTINKKFLVGIDRAKMKLLDLGDKSQSDLVDTGKVEKKEDDTPVFDASTKKNKKDFGEFKFE